MDTKDTVAKTAELIKNPQVTLKQLEGDLREAHELIATACVFKIKHAERFNV